VIPEEDRSFALEFLEGRQQRILSHFLPQMDETPSLGALYGAATEEELSALTATTPLVSLESHTWSHLHLPSVTPSTVKDELMSAQTWLEGIGQGRSGLLSFPYGATNEQVKQVAEGVGLNGAFLVAGGPISASELIENPLRIPRLNVPRGLTGEGLMARLARISGR
jgi:peptidoglycan/xylan/chitin deacetylase (PgdA/CDA1 family)